TMTPKGIVMGKLKSSMLQMGAFYSAAAPFIGFTYLLQGVSVLGLVIALLLTFLAGIAANMCGIMMGSLGKQTMAQIPCLLATIVINLIIFGMGFGSASSAVAETSSSFAFGALCAGLGCFGYVLLFFSL